jgi:hypothetical protein
MNTNLIMGDFLADVDTDAEKESRRVRMERWLRALPFTAVLLGMLGGVAQVKGWI